MCHLNEGTPIRRSSMLASGQCATSAAATVPSSPESGRRTSNGERRPGHWLRESLIACSIGAMFFQTARLLLALLFFTPIAQAAIAPGAFMDEYCADCHDAESKKGGLDLTSLAWDLGERGNFEEWVKVFDLATKGEMPPKKKARPAAGAQ